MKWIGREQVGPKWIGRKVGPPFRFPHSLRLILFQSPQQEGVNETGWPFILQLDKSPLHKEKYFRNLIISTWYQIVFTIFRLIWIQTDVRLDHSFLRFMVVSFSGASLGMLKAQLRIPLNPSDLHSTIILRASRGALNWSPSCRETLASRTTHVNISSL